MDNAFSAWVTVLSSPFAKGGSRGISYQYKLQNFPYPQSRNSVAILLMSFRASEARPGIQYFKFPAEPLYLTKYIDLIQMTLPEKRGSRLQKYRLTQKGKNLIAKLSKEEK